VDALVIVVIVLAVLMGLVGLGVVAGSGRARRMEEERIHADELRREEDFHDARAEESVERSRRFERRPPDEDEAPEEPSERLQGPRD
jgi:hypothetical protein